VEVGVSVGGMVGGGSVSVALETKVGNADAVANAL